jgi:hypothetical protein
VSFDNVSNPTAEEVRAWAYSGDLAPEQDWDLVLAEVHLAPTLIELVADERCPGRDFPLRVLYLLVGDAVRSGYQQTRPEDLEPLFSEAERRGELGLTTWATRSRQLLEQPDRFDYAAWCDGGLAREPNG